MAGTKEAIVIVLDVGQTTGDAVSGHATPLEMSLTCVNMLIQRKIFFDHNDEVALVLFGTEQTDNNLANEAEENGDLTQYRNISTIRDLTTTDWNLIEELDKVTASNVTADFVDALVVALDILNKGTQGKRFLKYKIIMFSNLAGEVADDQVDVIIAGIKKKFNRSVELKFVCPFQINNRLDVDDEANRNQAGTSNGRNNHNGCSDDEIQKPKTSQQQAGQKLMEHILSSVDGTAVTLGDILPGMKMYKRSKLTRSNPWHVNLEIGPDLQIPVTSYKKISEFTLPSYTVTAVDAEAMAENGDDNNNIVLSSDKTFHLNDEAQTEVEKDETTHAYCYGNTMVPFLEEDKINMEYKSDSKCFSVLGFTSKNNIKRHHFTNDKVDFIVSKKDDDAAAVALSALIHALFETDMVAIVRYAYRAGTQPRIGFLSPRIKSNYECLVFVMLPFMEDLRQFTFAPLDINSKSIPTKDQLDVIDDLINVMDLSKNKGSFHPKHTHDPHIQRFYQCMYHRVMNKHEPLPDIPEHIRLEMESSDQDEIGEKLKKAFPLHVVKAKVSEKTGASVFGTDKECEPPSKRSRNEDDLSGGLAAIIGVCDSRAEDATLLNDPNEKNANDNRLREPDEADDLLAMM